MHRAQMRTEEPPFLHPDSYDEEQQTYDSEKRVKHGGEAEVFSKDPHALAIEIKTKKTKRNAEEDQNTEGLDDPAPLRIKVLSHS